MIVLKGLEAPGEKRAAVLAGLLLSAPFAYSFGTNNDLLMHMGMASVFPFAVAVASIREHSRPAFPLRWAALYALRSGDAGRASTV